MQTSKLEKAGIGILVFVITASFVAFVLFANNNMKKDTTGDNNY